MKYKAGDILYINYGHSVFNQFPGMEDRYFLVVSVEENLPVGVAYKVWRFKDAILEFKNAEIVDAAEWWGKACHGHCHEH